MASEKCDGFFCGSNIKKNSIPADRLEIESLKKLLEELFKSEWFKDILTELSKEEWFKEMICSLGCSGTATYFNVTPSEIIFNADGTAVTTDTVTVDTNETGQWNVNC